MSSTSTSTSSHLVFFFCLLSALASAATATDHIVGANRGWNPGINYTNWANNHTFYVGDLISFRYQKTQFNVFMVNQTSYGNCTTEGAAGNWSSGKDFILLDKAKRYYFIAGNGQCFNGMKVSVVVHPLPEPPKAAVAAEDSATNSAAERGHGAAVFRAVLVFICCIWLRSGRIWI